MKKKLFEELLQSVTEAAAIERGGKASRSFEWALAIRGLRSKAAQSARTRALESERAQEGVSPSLAVLPASN